MLDLWTTTATIRRAPTAMHQWIYIYCSLQHAWLRRRQNRTVYAVLNLKQTCGRRIVVKLMTDTKHRAASLRQQSYLLCLCCQASASAARPDWQAEALCFLPVHLSIRPSILLSVTKLVNMIFWRRMNWFWCQLAQVVHGAGHETVSLVSAGQRSRLHKAEISHKNRFWWDVSRNIQRILTKHGWPIKLELTSCPPQRQ